MKDNDVPLVYVQQTANNLFDFAIGTMNSSAVPIPLRDAVDHDVCAPLNHIVNTFKDGTIDPDILKETSVQELNESYYLLDSLVRAIRRPDEVQVVSMNYAIESAVHQFLKHPKYTGIPIEFDQAPDVNVIASKPLIQLQFINLFKNILRYAADTDKIRITTQVHDGYVHSSVSDWGKTPLPNDFVPARRKTGGKGKGNALNFVNYIAEMYGGHLTHFQTDPDASIYKGTTLNISYPHISQEQISKGTIEEFLTPNIWIPELQYTK